MSIHVISCPHFHVIMSQNISSPVPFSRESLGTKLPFWPYYPVVLGVLARLVWNGVHLSPLALRWQGNYGKNIFLRLNIVKLMIRPFSNLPMWCFSGALEQC